MRRRGADGEQLARQLAEANAEVERLSAAAYKDPVQKVLDAFEDCEELLDDFVIDASRPAADASRPAPQAGRSGLAAPRCGAGRPPAAGHQAGGAVSFAKPGRAGREARA